MQGMDPVMHPGVEKASMWVECSRKRTQFAVGKEALHLLWRRKGCRMRSKGALKSKGLFFFQMVCDRDT